jgi:hypothetical protein
VAFRARLFNIGAEGQLYPGALAAVAVGGCTAAAASRPRLVAVPADAARGRAGRRAAAAGPALLKSRYGVDEVVTTLLLNFIVLLAWAHAGRADEGPDGHGLAAERGAAGHACNWTSWSNAAACTPACWPRWPERGCCGRCCASPRWASRSAPWARARARRPLPACRWPGWAVKVALLSGALAGLAGAVEVAGRAGYVTLDMSPGYGYSGIVIAMLAVLNPLARGGRGGVRGRHAGGRRQHEPRGGVPTYIADVIVAIALIAMLVATLLTQYRVQARASGDFMTRLLDLLLAAPFWVACCASPRR